ncbi:MAG: hypothetical protein EB060_01895 [Proteobacteria bacterium]|nr:hypothetical protein [Pseudomonadota bacterium]
MPTNRLLAEIPLRQEPGQKILLHAIDLTQVDKPRLASRRGWFERLGLVARTLPEPDREFHLSLLLHAPDIAATLPSDPLKLNVNEAQLGTVARQGAFVQLGLPVQRLSHADETIERMRYIADYEIKQAYLAFAALRADGTIDKVKLDAFNSRINTAVTPTTPKACIEAMVVAKATLGHLTDHCKEYLPGRTSEVARLDIREAKKFLPSLTAFHLDLSNRQVVASLTFTASKFDPLLSEPAISGGPHHYTPQIVTGSFSGSTAGIVQRTGEKTVELHTHGTRVHRSGDTFLAFLREDVTDCVAALTTHCSLKGISSPEAADLAVRNAFNALRGPLLEFHMLNDSTLTAQTRHDDSMHVPPSRKLSFADSVYKSNLYPLIHSYSPNPMNGTDAEFFTYHGGVSTDTTDDAGRKTGAYGIIHPHRLMPGDNGLNVLTTGGDKKENTHENFRRAADFMDVKLENLFVLQSQYGAGIVKIGNGREASIPEDVIVDTKPVKIRSVEHAYAGAEPIHKFAGDAIITDDPECPIAALSGDAHTILVRGYKYGGQPVMALVVGSHHGLRSGVLDKTIKAMFEEYHVEPDSIRIDIGPGLGPYSILDKDGTPGNATGFSDTSYEIGINDVKKFLAEEPKKPSDVGADPFVSPRHFRYMTEADFMAYVADGKLDLGVPSEPDLFLKKIKGDLSSRPDTTTMPPIFSRHPFKEDGVVINIEAMLHQIAVANNLSPHAVSSMNVDTYEQAKNFFSARRDAATLDKVAIAEEKGTSPDKVNLYMHTGRVPIIAKILRATGEARQDPGRSLTY